MSVAFVGKAPNALVGMLDQYRLTYQLTGSFLGLDDSLNASGVETRLYTALPQVGVAVRSVPQATTGDVVVVVRVQPTDMLIGSTVAQMADRVDLSVVDFTLGFDAFLGANVELTKVEYLGTVGGSNLPTGTGPLPSDAAAKETEQANAATRTVWDAFGDIIEKVGLLALLVVGVIVWTKYGKR